MATQPAPSHGTRPPIESFFATVHLAEPQSHGPFRVWPVVLDDPAASDAEPPYLPLRTAMASGAVQVEEVGEGSVPNVRVRNRGKQPVLFLFGEQIVGAKQNRVSNASFLIDGESETVIDVSCVEAGRWEERPVRRFEASEDFAPVGLKAKMARAVSKSSVTSGASTSGVRFTADQREVWDEIAHSIEVSDAIAPSSAWSDVAEQTRVRREDQLAHFPVQPGQVGVVAARHDAVMGLEVVGSPPVYAHHHRGLLGAFLHEEPDERSVRPLQPRFIAPEPFLQALLHAPTRSGPSLGLGEDIRFRIAEVGGCALAHEGLVHLTAFAQD